MDNKGSIVPAHPELEITDGWYRLRATVDEALARAARKKHLRIGRKLACNGAKVCATHSCNEIHINVRSSSVRIHEEGPNGDPGCIREYTPHSLRQFNPPGSMARQARISECIICCNAAQFNC